MRNAKKKVLVLASTFPRWEHDTTPPFVFELEKRLTEDFDIYVLAPHADGAKKYEEIHGLKIYRFQYFWPARLQKLCYEGGILPNLKKNKLLFFQTFTLVLFELLATIRIVRNEKIDLIHAHWIIPHGVVASIVNKLYSIPFIVTSHGSDIYGLKNKTLLRLKKLVLNKANKITVVSNSLRQEIIKKINPNLDVHVISMGVDSKVFNPSKRNEKIKKTYNIQGPFLLFVGRLSETKGVRYLINSMRDIVKAFPNSKLLIIGTGKLEKELKLLAKNLKLESSIVFVGPVPNEKLPEYYATADLFIGPSVITKEGENEGFGLTFVEAAFSGCLPIGTQVGGIPDIIIDKETGLLIKDKNPEAISNSTIYMLKNRSLLYRIKRQARNHLVTKFDWMKVKYLYSQVYMSL